MNSLYCCPPPLSAMEGRSPRRIVPGRRRARACGRSGEGAGGFRSQRRSYASASDTPSSHCGRCGAPRSGVPLRPQGGRGTMAAALASRFWRLGCPKIFHEVAAHLCIQTSGGDPPGMCVSAICMLRSFASAAESVSINLSRCPVTAGSPTGWSRTPAGMPATVRRDNHSVSGARRWR